MHSAKPAGVCTPRTVVPLYLQITDVFEAQVFNMDGAFKVERPCLIVVEGFAVCSAPQFLLHTFNLSEPSPFLVLFSSW